MKIAQVAPLFESVPPKAYGGTERVVSYLTEALVELGHEVTLYASGDSATSARLVPIVARSLRTDRRHPDWLVWHTLHARPRHRRCEPVRRDPLPRRRAAATRWRGAAPARA